MFYTYIEKEIEVREYIAEEDDFLPLGCNPCYEIDKKVKEKSTIYLWRYGSDELNETVFNEIGYYFSTEDHLGYNYIDVAAIQEGKVLLILSK